MAAAAEELRIAAFVWQQYITLYFLLMSFITNMAGILSCSKYFDILRLYEFFNSVWLRMDNKEITWLSTSKKGLSSVVANCPINASIAYATTLTQINVYCKTLTNLVAVWSLNLFYSLCTFLLSHEDASELFYSPLYILGFSAGPCWSVQEELKISGLYVICAQRVSLIHNISFES